MGLLLRPWRLFTEHISGKIILPYLVIVFLLAVLATYVVMSLVSTSIFDKFRQDLADGGRAANESMLKIEEGHLTVLRQMTFTVGVDEAIAGKDAASLQRLLGPIQVNTRIGYVDVFDAEGRQIFALRPQERQQDVARLVDPNAGSWGPVRRVLDGVVDELGDKHVSMVRTSWGEDIIYTAGPVVFGDQRLGVIAVGTPLTAVVGRLSQEAVMGITVYDTAGQLLASSIRGMTLDYPIADEDRRVITEEGQVATRPLDLGGDRVLEMIGTLNIRRADVAYLGVAKTVNIVLDTGTRTRDMLIVLFSFVTLVVLSVGLWLARQLTRPIDELVKATELVRKDELDFEVPILSRDETGVLAREFNTMVAGIRERNKAREAFGRYFSDDFYELVQKGDLSLGGEKREITILMSDIRSFTTLSEKMDPTALVAMLNEYFELQVAAIKRHGGEVDKYMGDAILAKFGAPRWYPDHARRAVLALLGMREGLEEFNRRRVERGEQPIRFGIGCNTGPAIVGNIGSTSRMEYTIIGDSVNATQRIEDLCKELKWDLLISDTTYEQVQDLVEVGEPHPIILRGRTKETLVYPLIGLKKATDETRRPTGPVIEHVPAAASPHTLPVAHAAPMHGIAAEVLAASASSGNGHATSETDGPAESSDPVSRHRSFDELAREIDMLVRKAGDGNR